MVHGGPVDDRYFIWASIWSVVERGFAAHAPGQRNSRRGTECEEPEIHFVHGVGSFYA